MSKQELTQFRPGERHVAAIPAEVQREILRAIGGIEYGSVEVIIHDSRVVQIEAREKLRFAGSGGSSR